MNDQPTLNNSFDQIDKASTDVEDAPLALRMRPKTLDEIVGQDHLIGKDKPLRKIIENSSLVSMIFWGPPGIGKTTIAEVISRSTNSNFERLSAVSAGVSDIRKIVDQAMRVKSSIHKQTILFIDEIHRFSKSQQDSVLPYVENGTVILIGATTENPSFEVNSALLSRLRLFVLKPLNDDHIVQILEKALKDKENGYGGLDIYIDNDILNKIATFSNGDARTALNILELSVNSLRKSPKQNKIKISEKVIKDVLQSRAFLYDKKGDQHYDYISALHKSLRGSDPDASLYWLARMLESGEDPLFIVRRLIRFASEDVGLANPQALLLTVAAQQAVHFVGMPESNVILAEAVIYLAISPKSNSIYEAYNTVKEDVESSRDDPVPLWIRNAPTSMMKDLDYGKGYKYSHQFYKDMEIEDTNFPPPIILQDYLPESLVGKTYYQPSNQGKEAKIKDWVNKRRNNKK